MSKPKRQGIIEQAREAVETQDKATAAKLLKKIDSKAYRFAATNTVNKVRRIVKAAA